MSITEKNIELCYGSKNGSDMVSSWKKGNWYGYG